MKGQKMTYKVIAYQDRFASVEVAANSEKDINWHRSDMEEQCACTECFAALDLKSVLKRKKNIDIEVGELGDTDFNADVLIFIGERCVQYACEKYQIPSKEVKDQDGYRICGKKADGKQIVLIYGGGRAGTLYGVSAYMEYHGIRFISPGDAGTYYNPELDKSRESEFEIMEVPSFKTRECYSEFVKDSRYELLLWLAHNKMNSAFMHTINSPEVLHKLCLNMSGGGHTIWYEYMDINHEYPYRHKMFGGEGKPDDPYPVSPYYEGDIDNDGILTYGEAHPEWYAETDGKRMLKRDYKMYREIGYATGDYICTSNEDGVTELCKLLVHSLSKGAFKNLSCIKLFGLDNGKWCQCEKCRDLPKSYRQLMLAYHLDKAIKKATEEGQISRKIRITIPAYHETLVPPDRPLPDDFDYEAISVTFYVIERCYVHDIYDGKCVETNKMLFDRLMSWVNGHYKGELTIGEYYNVSSFASMPFILTERMFHDIPYYYEIGSRHMHYMHMTASNWGLRAVNDFAYAKLLWNVNYEKEILKREYFTSKYNEDSDTVRSIYEELEKVCANCKRLKHYQYMNGRNRSLVADIKKAENTKLFDSCHMKYDIRADNDQAGPSLVETVTGFQKCYDDFCMYIKDKDFQLFKEDYEQLEYGLNMLMFIYYKALEILRENPEDQKQSMIYAKKLEDTTKPLDGYDVKKLFQNGLVATRMLEE